MPRGTNGTEPGARMMSLAVTILPPQSSVLGPAYTPRASMMGTPRLTREPCSPPRTPLTSCLAWLATFSRSYETPPTEMPMESMCFSLPISRTRPAAASSALDGTHPRFTHVPPTSPPDTTAHLSPWLTACRAAPWPPTPHPTMRTS